MRNEFYIGEYLVQSCGLVKIADIAVDYDGTWADADSKRIAIIRERQKSYPHYSDVRFSFRNFPELKTCQTCSVF